MGVPADLSNGQNALLLGVTTRLSKMCDMFNGMRVLSIEKHMRPPTLFPPGYGQAAMMAAAKGEERE
jgi:hypothetical protein